MGAGGGAGAQGFQGFHSNIDPEELFRNIFGDFSKGFGGQSSQSDAFDFDFSAPQELQLSLSFKEAAKGCTKEVKISVIDTCPKCNGSRSASKVYCTLSVNPIHTLSVNTILYTICRYYSIHYMLILFCTLY